MTEIPIAERQRGIIGGNWRDGENERVKCRNNYWKGFYYSYIHKLHYKGL